MAEEIKTTSETPTEEKAVEKKEEVSQTTATTKATPVYGNDKMKACKEKACAFWKNNKRVLIAVIILLVLMAASYGYRAYSQKAALADIGQDAIKVKVQAFVDANVPAGTKGVIKSITKQDGLYLVTITVGTQDVTAYASADGKKLFSGAADLDPQAAQAPSQQADASGAASQPVPKTDKPDVRLFVMSYCPYGTQEEKGILPVLKALGSKINFTLEFVSYSMHNSLASNDRKELDENMRQYCIQKNQPAALDNYLTCFLQKGQGTEASCMATAGVNAAQVATCMAQTDTQFNVTKDFNDQSSYQGSFPQFEINKADNAKYGVQGSPTLVLNGVQADSNRDSASILKTICGAFNNQPAECKTQLSSTPGAPGFGTAQAPAAAGAPAAACASPATTPAQ